MATGIQTGIRRGTRNATVEEKPQSLPAKIACFFRGLSPKVIMGMIAGAFLLLLIAGGLGVRNHHTGYVDLYPAKLAAHEVPEISRALLEAEIEHEVTPKADGILLARQDRIKARALLASRQLPLHRVLTADEAKTDLVRSAAEKRMLAQRLLEGEITMALRGVEGVHDARVNLAIPEQRFFNNGESTTASVALTLKPGAQLNASSVRGLSSLVAFSVPGLVPEKVVIVDSSGKELTAKLTHADELIQRSHFEVLAAEEMRRQRQLQEAMDAIYPGRTKVVVALEMDFSQAEKRIYTPGSEEDRGLVRDSMQLVSEVLEGSKGTRDSNDSKKYDNRKESTKFKYTENYYASLVKHARVERISAAVLADGISREEAAALRETVQGVLGIQPERADYISINTTPWDHNLSPVAPLDLDVPPVAEETSFPAGSGWILFLIGQGVLLFTAAGGVYLYSRHRGGAAILTDSPLRPTLGGIVDHRQSKMGETILESPGTSVQRSDMLAGIVKERPAQVADLLRSTWLS